MLLDVSNVITEDVGQFVTVMFWLAGQPEPVHHCCQLCHVDAKEDTLASWGVAGGEAVPPSATQGAPPQLAGRLGCGGLARMSAVLKQLFGIFNVFPFCQPVLKVERSAAGQGKWETHKD